MLVFVFSCILVNTDVWAVGGSGWDFALLRVRRLLTPCGRDPYPPPAPACLKTVRVLNF